MAHNTAEFEQLVNRLMKEFHATGLSIAIIREKEIEEKSYGYAKLPDQPCTTQTIFDLASTSKTTTAAAVACLVDDEKFPDVQWTTPVSKLLPDDFVLSDEQLTQQVTIEDILSHRTGYAGHESSYFSQRAKEPDYAKSITRNLRNLEIAHPLRTKFLYSNIMYTVTTHLVETVSGEKYSEFLRKRLWNPLGMDNTFHYVTDTGLDTAKDRQSTGYAWDKEKNEYISILSIPEPEGQGAGCIWSSAGDYAKWIRAVINKEAPLSSEAYKQLTTPRSIDPTADEIPFYSDNLYALGLQVESYRGHKIISHDGGVDGFRSKVGFMPKHNWGVVILGNSEGAFYVNNILFHVLMDDVLKVPVADRVDWEAFFRGWEEEGNEYEEKNKNDPDFQKPENPEPLGAPLDIMAGTYRNIGYKNLVLEVKDGAVFSDCTDRCYPFTLTFEHLTGPKFAVTREWVRTRQTNKFEGKVRLGDDENITAVGVDFEDALNRLIWFERVVEADLHA